LPQFEKAVEKYRGNPDVIFLAVSIDENRVAVRSFLASRRYTMPAAYDDGAAERFGIRGVPATFIIDANGIIRFSEEGFGAEDAGYLERLGWRVDDLLREKVEAEGANKN
jgi:thiol-disulfide isomerase/thioredoxin